MNNWQTKTFGEIFTILSNSNYSRAEIAKSGYAHYIHYGDIHCKYKSCVSPLEINDFILEKQVKNFDRLKTGDLILVDASEDYEGTTKCIELKDIVNEIVISGLHTIALRDKNNSFVNGFRAFITSIPKVNKELKKNVSGFKVFGISKTNLLKIKIPVPPLAEQEKIVSILSKQDEVIEKLEKLIEMKTKQKKGLMQRFIYTQKNTKSYKVKDLFELGRGRVISKNEIEKNKGIYPVYSSQTLDDGILGYINTYDFECKCITWTTDGANAGDVFYRNGRFNCTNVCGIAKAKDESMINLYYATCFLNHITKKYVSYVGNPKLMNGVFAVIPLELPEINIQNKVASILSKCDKEIELLKKKLNLCKKQKKWLMQKLLSGEIRVDN